MDADPETGQFPTINDRAILQLRSDQPRTTKVAIPAPKRELFGSNSVDLDLSATKVVSVRDKLFAYAADQQGFDLIELMSGHRAYAE